MKNLNSTMTAWSRCIVILTTIMFVITSLNFSYSQCSLACNGSTQVSLDVNCEADVTPEMILNDQSTSCPSGSFYVVVTANNQPIPTSPVVTGDYMGQTIVAEVVDAISGNSCWGYITIEDKLGPIIDSCPDTLDFACSELAVYEGPEYVDACEGPVDAILLSERITPVCDPDYIKIIERVYTAVDSKGFFAPQCTIVYRLERFDFDAVECPPNYTVYGDNSLSCDGEWRMGQGLDDDDPLWDDNMNGYPDPEEVGAPFIINDSGDTISLYPFPDVYCNSAVTFTDFELPQVGCSRKIMRSWVVREWHCTGEVSDTCLQILEIFDSEAPVVTCNPSMTLTTNTLTGPVSSSYGSITCGATTGLTLPSATDNCSDNLSYDLTYPGGFVNGYNGGAVTLPMGTNAVTFTVYDECYNSSTCAVVVEVVDNTPPIAVCDQYTVVSLTTGGTAKVNATSFDDGSYDDCKDHCMLVRRMDADGCDCNIPTFCNLDYIGELNGSYYYLSDYEISATIAKSRAAAYGGHLAIFETYTEEDWLVNQIRQNTSDAFWIGMKSFGGGWLWDNHTAVNYTNWAAGQPTGGLGEDCVYVGSDERWYDSVCTDEYRYVIEINDICGFSETATFCCSDVGEDNMVVFRVIDVFGNFNDCMVNVEVQDKLAPSVVCPANQTVDCDTPYNIDNLSILFGEASVLDDCGATVSESVLDSLNQCNIGNLTRIFTATDNGGRSSSCKQVITFVDDMSFIDLSESVVCPEDVTIFGCFDPQSLTNELSPDQLGYPALPVDVCALIGVDWDDEVFTFNNFNGEACFKILRTWEIIDWCRQDPFTGDFEVFTCQQVIKVNNTEDPVFTSSCDSITVCTYDSECEDGFVELVMTADDECTENDNLRWRYRIFAGALGSGPSNLDGTPLTEKSGSGNTATASGVYPIGTHVVQWTFFDRCGNATTCNQVFTVMNCKAPTAYCISGLAVDLMPMDVDNDGQTDFGMVELWASDFDAGSSHPCGYEVILSFSPDTSEQNMIFDCTDIGDAEVEIWASVVDPNGSVIQSFCETFINVQDNMNSCIGQSDVRVDVEGIVYTEELETVENIEVKLGGSPLSTMTGADGGYAFPEMPTGGDYIIDPYSNAGPLNGVSTLDIIEIQKHILGIDHLDSPYKVIAADINKDTELTSLDLIELRKVILGVYEEFPNNDSWRFVDKGYVFQDPLNPFNETFTEDYEIYRLNNDMYIDFIAVKVGDVNNSVNLSGSTDSNEQPVAIDLVYEAGEVRTGDLVSIPVTSLSGNISGYQMTLDFDESALEVLSISGPEFADENYRVLDGRIVISWNSTNTIERGETLFTVEARAKSDVNMAKALTIGKDNRLNAEAYVGGSILDLALRPAGAQAEVSENEFALFQNSPNPFASSTEISFVLPQDDHVEISIHDVHGKLIGQINGNYGKGINRIQLDKSQLNAHGLMYLTLKSNTHTSSIKMVVIE